MQLEISKEQLVDLSRKALVSNQAKYDKWKADQLSELRTRQNRSFLGRNRGPWSEDQVERYFHDHFSNYGLGYRELKCCLHYIEMAEKLPPGSRIIIQDGYDHEYYLFQEMRAVNPQLG